MQQAIIHPGRENHSYLTTLSCPWHHFSHNQFSPRGCCSVALAVVEMATTTRVYGQGDHTKTFGVETNTRSRHDVSMMNHFLEHFADFPTLLNHFQQMLLHKIQKLRIRKKKGGKVSLWVSPPETNSSSWILFYYHVITMSSSCY